MDITLDNGYMSINGLLSKTGSYGRETLKIAKRKFENESDAIGNPSEEVIYFDKDNSWDIELNNLIYCIDNDLKVFKSNYAAICRNTFTNNINDRGINIITNN